MKILTFKTLDHFFKTLSEEWPHRVEILLFGGAAGLIMGSTRPTRDVDFEISFASKNVNLENFERVIERVKERTGIDTQFSEDAARWSMISFLDYAKHKRPFKHYGKISVFFLDASYWSIGKVSRYWDQDIKDMILVFRKEKTDPLVLARLWRKALHQSPTSTRLFNVKKQMSHFFKTHGPKIWGKKLPLEKILPLFEK